MEAKKLVLENGIEIYGQGFGNEKVAELIFNTEMIGYQDILEDPGYSGKIVCMTYPLIANYGASDDDFGSNKYHVEGFIVKDFDFVASNFRYADSMVELLEANDIPFLCDVDTRMISRIIRDEGSMKCIITNANVSKEEALEKIKNYTPEKNIIKKLTSKRPTVIKANKPKYAVACIDLGIKKNVIENLTKRNCNLTLYPYNVSAEDILKSKVDGVFITSGPECLDECDDVIETIKSLKGKLPIAGIGFGHILIAKAFGAKVQKMKCGHHGANLSVRNLETNKIDITSQNHGYVVLNDSLEGTGLSISHINITDNSIEGLVSKENKVLTLQYYPENAEGHISNKKLYDELIRLMKSNKGESKNA